MIHVSDIRMIDMNLDSQGIATLTIARQDAPANVIDDAFLIALEAALQEAISAKAKGIVLISGREEFVAGADLKLFLELKGRAQVLGLVRHIHKLFRSIETAGIPVVAAVSGTALGGGYELCLACHRRIALDAPALRIGLPEVGLGLFPGGGGTQRLARLIGLEAAAPLILEGTRLSVRDALAKGLVDELAATREELHAKARAWALANPQAKQPWDMEKFRAPGSAPGSPKGAQFLAAASAMLFEKTRGNYPAPRAALSALYEGLLLPFEQGLEVEAQYFTDMALSREARHMIRTLFYGINTCNKGADKSRVAARSKPKRIGVLGAGMMGAGIAYVTAKSGLPVLLKDISRDAAEKGKDYSRRLLEKAKSRGKATAEEEKALLDKIETSGDPASLAGCDLVVEAVTEDRALKARVTHETEQAIREPFVFASNTSTLPITGLAAESRDPKSFIGLHFFSPVDKMQLVEVIVGNETSEETLARALDYVRMIKKTPIVVNDGRGFFTSRVFTKYIEEGMLCLADGIAPALIENAGLLAGMPVGPLCVADEVSLELMRHVLGQTKADLGKAAVNAEMDALVEKFVVELKRPGRKAGAGFYDYPAGVPKRLWAGLAEVCPRRPERDDVEEVKRRLLWRQTLESLRCLEEGILRHARDGDVGSVLGWGFPAYTGGALSFVEFVGAADFLATARGLEQRYGARFAPPKILSRLAEGGASLYGAD